ncbi:hypothetical protein AVEN_180427-1 [Araneus ventricosus]|uniref:Uncharacterized protein n=1 Tax=Araneus ventricosus TaxID=182803 RepID=A0A4Y2U5Z3_ARAVE|nr:hypothetical protein AVEN_156718-1 [Araneus ventricosus]GBO08042.1 hypothetical protein AVEN_180427-1 [Araneus ventricosus]
MPGVLKRSDKMKIIWCDIRAAMDVLVRPDPCLSRTSALLTQIPYTKPIPVFVTLDSPPKLPLVGDEFQLRMFCANAKTLLHLAFQSPTMYPSTPPSSNSATAQLAPSTDGV